MHPQAKELSMRCVAVLAPSFAIGLAALVVVPASSCVAAEEGAGKLSLTTDYLFERVHVAKTPFGGHWLVLNVTLDAKGSGKGTLVIDPNSQRFNEFGDTADVTEIATSSVDITVEA